MNEIKDKSFSELMKEHQLNNLGEIVSNVVPITGEDLSHIKPMTLKELLNDPMQPSEIILHPWLPQKGIAFIYAATGVGKTMFTMNVAYAIAEGGSFLKFKCPKPKRVLYVDGEMAYEQVKERFKQIAKQQGELNFEENCYILTPDKISPNSIPKICSPDGQHYYNSLIEKLQIDVIILDNLSVLSTVDENKQEEWKIIQHWLITLRQFGRTVIVVHHAGKDKTGYRGTSKMLDCIDTAISLQELTDDSKEEYFYKKFKIVYQKNRTFWGEDSLPFEVCLQDNIWSHQSISQTEMDKVIDRVRAGMTQRDIAKELFCSQPKIFKLIRKARKLGLLPEKE